MFAKVSVCSVLLLIGLLLVPPATPMFLGAQEKPKIPDAKADKKPELAEGVIHVKLPPGELRMENIVRDGRPILRVTVGKTVIETRAVFLGDGKGVVQIEAIKEGMHWVPAKGGKGFVIDGTDTHEPGATIGAQQFITVDKLKAGSLYVTTPSINFLWGKDAKDAMKD